MFARDIQLHVAWKWNVTMRPRPRTTPTARWLAIALAMLLLLTTVAQPATAQPSTPRPGLDLAALVLGPDDLDAVGMPGYGADLGRSYFTPEEMLDDDVVLFGRLWATPALVPGAATILTADTWHRYHEMHVATPVPDEHSPIRVFATATSGIEEYVSPGDAATGFSLFTSEAALNPFAPATVVTILPVTTPLGDEAVLARSATTIDGVTYVGVASIVRVGSRILNVTLADTGQGPEPDPTVVERLMARLVSRVETAQDAGSIASGCLPTGLGQFGTAMTGTREAGAADAMPGLDRCVQRLAGENVDANLSGYLVRNRQVVNLFPALSEAELAEEQAYVTDAGLHHHYQARYRINGPNGIAFYYVDILAYTDAATAATRFETAEERLRGDTTFAMLEFERGPLDLGDDSYRYTRRYLGNDNAWTVSGVRSGHIVVVVSASGLPEPIPAVVDQLLVTQVACMEANDCIAPLPAPPALYDGILHRAD